MLWLLLAFIVALWSLFPSDHASKYSILLSQLLAFSFQRLLDLCLTPQCGSCILSDTTQPCLPLGVL